MKESWGIRKKITVIIVLALAVLIAIAGIIYSCKRKQSAGRVITSEGYISVYEKLSAGESVNVLIVGDSIAQGAGASDGKSWAKLLKAGIEEEYGVACNMTNVSMGGNTSIAGIVREMALDDGISYDLAVICYGENDLDDESFAANYEGIVRGIKAKYSGCSIISVLESSQREYTNKINQIIAIDEYYGIPVADTIAAFNESGHAYEELVGAPDDLTHPNDFGHEIYYETVSEVIRGEVAKAKAFDEKTHKYDNFVYYPKSAFTKKGDSSFTITVDPAVVEMAISRSFVPGENGLKIYVDGNLIVDESFEWSYGFEQPHITEVTEEPVSVTSEIRIEFANKTQAESFEGLALYYR